MMAEREYNPTETHIDFGQISKFEGGQVLEPENIPNLRGSDSGVTVATGFDLGQRDESDLDALGLDDELKAKLAPYLGLTGQAAQDYLSDHPLELTEDEANAIDAASKRESTDKIIHSYNNASDLDFLQLPSEAQTVIASVAYQYGDLSKKTPSFWKDVTTGDWNAAVRELRNFGDAYPTRRNKEADILQEAINRGALLPKKSV